MYLQICAKFLQLNVNVIDHTCVPRGAEIEYFMLTSSFILLTLWSSMLAALVWQSNQMHPTSASSKCNNPQPN
eukprot:m.265398 g.265398  ORF g.265398 m.265398 type:complete len:73 (+) comp19715_c1_seq59:5480-5698(+)